MRAQNTPTNLSLTLHTTSIILRRTRAEEKREHPSVSNCLPSVWSELFFFARLLSSCFCLLQVDGSFLSQLHPRFLPNRVFFGKGKILSSFNRKYSFDSSLAGRFSSHLLLRRFGGGGENFCWVVPREETVLRREPNRSSRGEKRRLPVPPIIYANVCCSGASGCAGRRRRQQIQEETNFAWVRKWGERGLEKDDRRMISIVVWIIVANINDERWRWRFTRWFSRFIVWPFCLFFTGTRIWMNLLLV